MPPSEKLPDSSPPGRSFADPSNDRRPQIALTIFAYFAHGGLQRDCVQIARALQQRGLGVEIVAGRLLSSPPDDVPITVLGVSGWTNHGRDHDFAARFATHRRKQRYDVVVGFDAIPGLDIYFAGQTPHSERIAPRNRLSRLLPRNRARVALEAAVASSSSDTQILALTEEIVAALRRHYGTPADRFTLIAPTIGVEFRIERDREADRRSVQAELSIPPAAAIVAFVGSHFKTKGLDRALTSFAKAHTKAAGGAVLLVIGADRAEPYLPLVERLGIHDRVHFTGGRDDIARLMTASDLLLHPAREEATGGVLIEAMASGLPILCTATCGYAPLVVRAGAGHALDEPFDQHKLDAALAGLLAAPWRDDWSRNGRDYVREAVPLGWREEAVNAIERMARERSARR